MAASALHGEPVRLPDNRKENIMTRKPDAIPAQPEVSVLEEVDLANMEKVSGGCANGQTQAAGGESGNKLAALAPLIGKLAGGAGGQG